jgi:hypothetical protein
MLCRSSKSGNFITARPAVIHQSLFYSTVWYSRHSADLSACSPERLNHRDSNLQARKAYGIQGGGSSKA